MKKILLGMILIVLSFSLTGCNNDETSSHENSETIYVESKIIDNLKNAVRVDIRELAQSQIVKLLTN